MNTHSHSAATVTVPDDGLTIVADDTMPRDLGRMDPVTGTLRLHPLEAIRLNNEGHPITELHAACAYIVERAGAALDALADHLRDDMETLRNRTACHPTPALAAGPSGRSTR